MSVPAEQMYQAPPPSGVFNAPEQPHPLVRLLTLLESDNIAADLKDADLKKIGSRCVEEYKQDLLTREDWQKQCDEGLKLAKQVADEKSWPWANAANVKFPLLSEAAISFSARAYPELVKGDVVKAEVTGNDPQGLKAARAARVSKFQTWQLSYKMPYWAEETDSLLVMLPLVGNVFRKVYRDPQQGAQARLVRAQDFVVNHRLKSLELARRETELMEFFGNEVEEKMRSGEWRRVKLSPDQKDGVPEGDKPYIFLEQHRWLDLDEDGYEEPYIVTVHEASGEVVRIVARFTSDDVTVRGAEVVKITPQRFYIHYSFIPNPDGGLYAFGLCNLLYPIAESINTVLNQLLDAGTLSNLQGGLIAKGVRIKGGQLRFSPGEWKFVDSTAGVLKDSIVPIPAKEPSPVLFQLLGLLIDSGRSLANLKDVLSGDAPPNQPATTTLALIEQGQKVYSGIYTRIFRAMGREFKAVFVINSQQAQKDPRFLQEYATVLDDQMAQPDDFNTKDYDVCPVADPATSSQAQRLARAQVLMPLAQIPGMKQDEIVTEYLSAAGFTNVDRFYDPKSAQSQQMQAMQEQMRQREIALTASVADATAKLHKAEAEIVKLQTEAIKNLADAEAAEAGTQLDQYNAQREMLDAQTRAQAAQNAGGQSGQSGSPSVEGGMAGMAGAPGNGMVPMGSAAGQGINVGNPGGGADGSPVVG